MNYSAMQAGWDAILFQKVSAKLQKEVIAEELDFDQVVKYGHALEQGVKKVEQMRVQPVRSDRRGAGWPG